MMRTSLILCGLLAGAASMPYGAEAPGGGGEVANGTLRAGAGGGGARADAVLPAGGEGAVQGRGESARRITEGVGCVRNQP